VTKSEEGRRMTKLEHQECHGDEKMKITIFFNQNENKGMLTSKSIS
jgi:hypothetical protein